MIKCDLEQLPKEKDRELRSWLGSDQYQTLVRVIECKVKDHECKALAAALQSGPNNLKGDAADAEMEKARRYHHCLEVLAEVRKHPANELFNIAKLT